MKMKTSSILLVSFCLAAASAAAEETCRRRHGPLKDDWNTYRVILYNLIIGKLVFVNYENYYVFQKFHGKRYRSEKHHEKSLKNFQQNKMKIQEHNKLFEEGKVLNKMGKP